MKKFRVLAAVSLLYLVMIIGEYLHLRSMTQAGFHLRNSAWKEDSPQFSLIEAVNFQRIQRLRNHCLRSGKNSLKEVDLKTWEDLSIYLKPRLYLSDSLKLIICETPKCGSTQWRDLTLVSEGLTESLSLGREERFFVAWNRTYLWNVHNVAQRYEAFKVRQKLKSYNKIMTVREPLERLVSAYKDKIENTREGYYEEFKKNITRTKNGSKDSSPSFEEFIKYILELENPLFHDPHWKPYSYLCDPCTIQYDYILKMETIHDEIAYFKKELKIGRHRIFEDKGRKLQERRDRDYVKYYEKLPPEMRLKIFKYYKDQYDMFGYDYPSFINKSDLL